MLGGHTVSTFHICCFCSSSSSNSLFILPTVGVELAQLLLFTAISNSTIQQGKWEAI